MGSKLLTYRAEKRTNLGKPRSEPGAAGWEARMLLLCYAAPRVLLPLNSRLIAGFDILAKVRYVY